MHVILFDIDGTLMLTGGAGQEALEKVVGGQDTCRPEHGMLYAGRTDRSIISDLFQQRGIADTPENYRTHVERFLGELSRLLPSREGFVLPGVVDLLEDLHARAAVHLGLLTGNLRRAARLKLEHYRLARFFYGNGDAVGGFGDHHHERDDVAREAWQEIQQKLVGDVEPSNVWVIGDTPRDVKCARAIGAKVVAVATGGYTLDELAETDPDLLLADLTCVGDWLMQIN